MWNNSSWAWDNKLPQHHSPSGYSGAQGNKFFPQHMPLVGSTAQGRQALDFEEGQYIQSLSSLFSLPHVPSSIGAQLDADEASYLQGLVMLSSPSQLVTGISPGASGRMAQLDADESAYMQRLVSIGCSQGRYCCIVVTVVSTHPCVE